MNIIEKITDTLLSKNWIITTVSFVKFNDFITS